MQTRPSYKELAKKLKQALEALSCSSGLFANPSKVVAELMDLNIIETEEIWPLILELLKEIKPQDYVGGRPPYKSYESMIRGKELFAFSWSSKKLSKQMYLKFALTDGQFYYISLHKDRPTGS